MDYRLVLGIFVFTKNINYMSNLTLIQEVEFTMDDISDEVDFYVTEKVVMTLFSKRRLFKKFLM